MSISHNIYDPSQISQVTVRAVERERDAPGYLKTEIAKLDAHYFMFRSRRVNGIEADTSNGKTSFKNILARNFIPQLLENEIILWVTWEDSIEDFGMNAISNLSKIPVASLFHGDVSAADWKKMLKAAAEQAAMPLWAMGHSEEHSQGRPRLTMTDVLEGVDYIRNKQGKRIRAMFLDYLQRINTDDTGRRDTRERFVAAMDSIKDVALDSGACVIVGSQVKREVGDRKWKQPQIHDAQETSNFEQTCDGIISLWIPKKTEPIGSQLTEKRGEMDAIFVTERLMLIQTLKQKRGKAPVLTAMDFYPETNELKEVSK